MKNLENAIFSSSHELQEMCQDIFLFTGFWVVWFFVTGAQSEIYFTNITRSNLDIFTNSFCGNCSEYGATEDHVDGSCRCDKPGKTPLCSPGVFSPIVDPGSVFLRSKRKCISHCDFKRNRAAECFSWENKAMKVINVERVNSSYKFQQKQVFKYQSCQWTKLVEFLDAGENWTAINISANAFQVLKVIIQGRYLKLKVTERSAALASLSGHIIKLGLNCTRRKDNGFDSRCLIFKSQGNLNFPLCNYTVTPPPTPCTATPVIAWTSSITSTPSTTTCPPIVKDPPDNHRMIVANHSMIVALVAVGAVLCCAFAAFALYRYKRQSSRDLQGREVNDFMVIRNPGPQTYRVQEEPIYDELCDIDPNNVRSTGNSAGMCKEKQVAEGSVLLNPYASVASYVRPRLTTDPLPSRPHVDENTRPENLAGYVPQSDGHRHDKEDASIVLKNPRVQETLRVSLPKSVNDLDRLPESPGKEEMVSEHHHHPSNETADGNGEDLNYQGLLEGRRPQSVFVCPSCNEKKDQDYQRLTRPSTCQHEKADESRQKNPDTVYQSLSPESETSDSLYAKPSHVGETANVEDVDKRTKDVTPEYHILEPDKTEASQEPDEPACHDYKVLEEPKQTCSEFDQDNNKLSDPRPAEEDPEMPSSEILSMESNPAYVVPWKMNDTGIPVRKRSYSM